jgi:PAS domain S-box-containing protein
LKQILGRSKRHLPVFALVCFGIFVSAFTFVSVRSIEEGDAKAAFQRAAQERFEDVQSDLDVTIAKVVALGAFCEASYPVTRASFEGFATPLLSSHEVGIPALAWIPKVSLRNRAAFEAAARRGGLPGYEIRDRLKQGETVRAADRPEYFPVLYELPHAGNEAAVGYDDLGNNFGRREAILRAASTGELAASRRVNIVQVTSSQYGILIFRPVYSHAGSHPGEKQLLGFASGVLRLNNVVERHGAESGVDLRVTDLSASTPGELLYPSSPKQAQPVSFFTQYRTIRVGGRNWQMTASPMPGAFSIKRTNSYLDCAVSLLITFMFAAFVKGLLSRRWKVERLVEERTSALNKAIDTHAELHRGLEESESRYRHLVENSPSAIVVERQGKIILANRAAIEMFGFDSWRDVEDQIATEFVIPERREFARKLFEQLRLRDGQASPRETRLIRRDGSVFDAEIAASSFLQDGHRNIQIIMRDNTQRKRAEAENARLIRAIEQVAESIVITDLQANIVYVNPAFERITGYSREEVLGKNPCILRSEREPSEVYEAIWQSVKAGESWSGHMVERAKNGRSFTEEATISPVINRKGAIINYVAVKRDVTLEIELQERLHQSQKMDAIGRLAGGVAHDFNNLLMVIVSYAELIASSLPEGDPLRKHTGQIMQAAQRSAALTRQLLAFGRKQVLAPQVLNCNVILRETSSMVRRLISESIDLKCNLAPDLWNVKADADQIVQVILNLCVNSRDAMPNGGSLVLSSRNYHLDQGFVEISVSDTGIGISPEVQEKLFEPFFTTKELGKGTGLGLATVYGIIQQSGGSIRVDSSPGHGATFTIHLPRCSEDAALPEAPVHEPRLAGQSLVLVVEDEDALREVIAAHLRKHGYQVLVAANGIEALDLLDRNPDIAILISDLIMPRMGGRELVRLAVEKTPGLHCIVMSGYAEQALVDHESAGASMKHLQKPFGMDVLLSRIAELNCVGALPRR